MIASKIIDTLLAVGHTVTWVRIAPSLARFRLQHVVVLVGPSNSKAENWQLFEYLRRDQVELSIIAITQSSDSAERVYLLDAGADDCLSQDGDNAELLARVYVACRRAYARPPVNISVGQLRIDRVNRSVHHNDGLIDLSPQEFKILEFLAANDGIELSREEISHFAWPEKGSMGNNIDVQIGKLKKKIETKGSTMISNVRGVGFRLGEPKNDMTRYYEGRNIRGRLALNRRINIGCVIVDHTSLRCKLRVTESLVLPELVDLIVPLHDNADQRRRLQVTRRDADQVLGAFIQID